MDTIHEPKVGVIFHPTSLMEALSNLLCGDDGCTEPLVENAKSLVN